ncbi:MAG: hypothetical protein WBC44_07000 [Planctomycetaceae bacterium]
MTTKTKPIDADPCSQLADMERDRLKAVETALRRESAGEPLSEDALFLIQRLGWDNLELAKQRARAERIERFQREAGTAAEREKAMQDAERIARSAAERRREIETQIASLSAELRGLDGQERASAALVTRQNHAVDRLRQDCPEHIKQHAAVLRHEARVRFGKPINDYTADIRHHDHLASLRDGELIEALRNNPVTKFRCLHQSVGRDNRIAYRLNDAGFRAYLDSLEVDRKRDELPRLREAFDAAIAEADKLLNHYVDT